MNVNNYAIEFKKCPGKKIFFRISIERYMKRAGKTFSCPWLLIHYLFDEKAVPLEEKVLLLISVVFLGDGHPVYGSDICLIYNDFPGFA